MPETSEFVYPPTFERFEIMVSGRMKDSPWKMTGGTDALLPLLNKALLGELNEAASPEPWEMIEVGSWAGSNAYRIATSLGIIRLYCVDHWKGSRTDVTSLIAGELGPRAIFEGFCKNMGDLLFDRVFPCVGASETWAAIWPRQVAAIYIDAGHDYESVTQDLNAWWPHILPGGLFIGHDYKAFPDVKQAVHDWHKPEYGALESDEELWWVWKKRA